MLGYVHHTQPYDHQKKANERSWNRASFAFLMEMGTGKTKVAIDEMCAMYEAGLIDAAVVFAPKGVYGNWVNTELPTHMPPRIMDKCVIAQWRAGGGSKAHQAFLAEVLEWTDFKILVINIEALSSGTHGYLYLNKFIASAKRLAAYVDESTSIRTHDATRTKRMLAIRDKFLYRRIMSGLIAPRSPLDLFSQFTFLDTRILGYTSYFAFRSRFAVMKQQYFGGRKVNVVVGYRDVNELSDLIQPHSFRVTKDECLDLPEKIYTVREVELTEEQERIYKDIRENARAALEAPVKCPACVDGYVKDDGAEHPCLRCGGMGEVAGAAVSATAVITQILRLHQVVCGHVTDEDGLIHDIPSRRIDELMQVLQETDNKTIIWARYRRDIEKIFEAISTAKDGEGRLVYGPDSVVQYHGGISDADRKKAIYRFQGHIFENNERLECPKREQARFFVGNAQTGGFGLTLTAAKSVVYYSNDYDLEKRL